jgi:hypothetical protein
LLLGRDTKLIKPRHILEVLADIYIFLRKITAKVKNFSNYILDGAYKISWIKSSKDFTVRLIRNGQATALKPFQN